MNIEELIKIGCKQLDGFVTPRLDVELLLSHTLKKPIAYLYSWKEKEVSDVQQEQFFALLGKRIEKQPIAYILGKQGFWSLELDVSEDVLVPRPETELLVEEALKLLSKKFAGNVLDLGTGSGAIALALAVERIKANIFAVDYSANALIIAKKNYKKCCCQNDHIGNIEFLHGNWFQALKNHNIKFDIIVSNPPYIDADDPCLSNEGVCCEPGMALSSGKDGLDDLLHIINNAYKFLKPKGWLLLEHGCKQGNVLREFLLKAGYTQIATCQDLSGLDRVTIAAID